MLTVGDTHTHTYAHLWLHAGAGNSGAAKRAMGMTSAIAFGLAAALAAALVALGEPWARLFSRDEGVVAVVVSSMPFLACSIVFDRWGTTECGGGAPQEPPPPLYLL